MTRSKLLGSRLLVLPIGIPPFVFFEKISKVPKIEIFATRRGEFSLQDVTGRTAGRSPADGFAAELLSVRRFASPTLKKADGTEDYGETLCAELWCPPRFVPWRAKERGLMAEAMSEVQSVC